MRYNDSHVQPFPKLVNDPSNGMVKTGSTIKLLTPEAVVKPADGSSQLYVAFITVTGPVFAPATPFDGGFSVTVPKAPEGTAPITGQSYAVLTGCNTYVDDSTVAAGPAIIEIMP